MRNAANPASALANGITRTYRLNTAAGVLGEQADEPDKDVVDQIIVRVVSARDLIERPAEGAGQLAVAALHLTDPVDAVAAVEHRHMPVQPPQLEEPYSVAATAASSRITVRISV